jgi:hypothetical protein
MMRSTFKIPSAPFLPIIIPESRSAKSLLRFFLWSTNVRLLFFGGSLLVVVVIVVVVVAVLVLVIILAVAVSVVFFLFGCPGGRILTL